MKIAIASGKGGTGKTTIATNLAWAIAQKGQEIQYLDCDVEEPNGHIFLKPDLNQGQIVTVVVPEVDLKKCNRCGKCGKICQFSAIVCLKDTVITFDQLCHSCGGCMLVCPTNAIKAKHKIIGVVQKGTSGNLKFVQGLLNIGDVRSPALIRQVKQNAASNGITIIDAPPGTSCPVIESIKDTDLVLLVTEPTPFGLNDLKLAVGMVRKLRLPFAVIINRTDIGDKSVHKYCKQENIDIALTIPDDRRIAEVYSKGHMIVEELPDYEKDFEKLYEFVKFEKATISFY